MDTTGVSLHKKSTQMLFFISTGSLTTYQAYLNVNMISSAAASGAASAAARATALVSSGAAVADTTAVTAHEVVKVDDHRDFTTGAVRTNVKNIVNAGSNAAAKRANRISAIKMLFDLDADMKQIKFNKADLVLPAAFPKQTAVVFKAGEEIFTYTAAGEYNLSSSEGYYAVLDEGESVTVRYHVTLGITFLRPGAADSYTVTLVTGAGMITDWDDVNANFQKGGTGGGTFNPETTPLGTLLPNDTLSVSCPRLDPAIVTLIGSVGQGGGGGGGGDPYITPRFGSTFKLPNKSTNYRLYENEDVFINARVDEATESHKQAMIEYNINEIKRTNDITASLDDLLVDGYFFRQFFIAVGDNKMCINLFNCSEKNMAKQMEFLKTRPEEKVYILNAAWDYKTNKLTGKTGKTYKGNDFFTINKPIWTEEVMNYHVDNQFVNMTISWEHPKFGKTKLNIKFFNNPQHDNGISIESITGLTGLLVRNYKPKYMEIPSIETQQYKKLHKRIKNAKNLFTKKAITNKNEVIEYY